MSHSSPIKGLWHLWNKMRKWKQVVSKYGISKMQLPEMCDVFGLWQNWAFWLRLFQHIPCHQHTLSHQHILCHNTSFAITHLLPPTHLVPPTHLLPPTHLVPSHILCHHTSPTTNTSYATNTPCAITHLLPPTHTRQYGAHCCSEISQEGIFVCALEDWAQCLQLLADSRS